MTTTTPANGSTHVHRRNGSTNGTNRGSKVVVMKIRPSDAITVNGSNFTRCQISRDTGLSLSHVSRIFSGQRKPSLATARALANYFGVSTDALADLLSAFAPTVAA